MVPVGRKIKRLIEFLILILQETRQRPDVKYSETRYRVSLYPKLGQSNLKLKIRQRLNLRDSLIFLYRSYHFGNQHQVRTYILHHAFFFILSKHAFDMNISTSRLSLLRDFSVLQIVISSRRVKVPEGNAYFSLTDFPLGLSTA